jgi:glycine/D-amino acid oxidase-like deaminating enzyme
MEIEYAIIGGGVVGLSVAHGLLSLGKRVAVFDEGDNGIRASRGNFGLIWVQGKGLNLPAYSLWTRRSASAWRSFANELEEQCNTDLKLQQNGGFRYCLDEDELAQLAERYRGLAAQTGDDYPFEVLGHNALRREEPNIGPDVAGATLHHEDGHVNSLSLLRSLAISVRQQGGQIINPVTIDSITRHNSQFDIQSGQQHLAHAANVVLCSGIGNRTLGPSLGFKAPVRPQRGQVLITEKTAPLMYRPSDVIRQVDEGGVQIGASAEEVGTDDRDSLAITAQLAAEARQLFPALGSVNIVRSWGALRIMSPDGLPIYQQSKTHPGAFFVTCHSGITLAAAHAKFLPLWITGQVNAPDLDCFSEERFETQPH